MLDFSHAMTMVIKLTNSILAKALQHRLFQAFLDELDAAYGDLVLYADVRWLSRGKMLQRFADLLPEIETFLSTRNKDHEELGFLTDLTAKLNAR